MATMTFPLIGCCLSVLSSALLASGCASTRPEPDRDVRSPSSPVATDDAWQDAKELARGDTGRSAAMGTGESMQPLYGENTILVISPIAFEKLRAGMSVAYVNSRGQRVVHRLLRREKGGWRVIGLNNAEVDEDRVTPANLLGVIYATFNHGGSAGGRGPLLNSTHGYSERSACAGGVPV